MFHFSRRSTHFYRLSHSGDRLILKGGSRSSYVTKLTMLHSIESRANEDPSKISLGLTRTACAAAKPGQGILLNLPDHMALASPMSSQDSRPHVKSTKTLIQDESSNFQSHNVLEIAPVAIIDRQLPFKYTIASRSTNVMVMVHHAQNINHSAFRSIFEREKLFGKNFNDWFCQLKLVLRVEKKMQVIEQPISPALAVDSAANMLAEWNAVYDVHNEVACLMLGSITPGLHRQFENYSPYEILQEL
ncbi:hypothetical protein Tco_0781493 [Tanacetum coccineum]